MDEEGTRPSITAATNKIHQYDRESLRKSSERKGYCKKGQRREGKGGEHCKKDQIKRREGLSQVHEVKYDLKPGINS